MQLARAEQAAVVETLEAHAPEIVLFRIVCERAEVLGNHRTHLQRRKRTQQWNDVCFRHMNIGKGKRCRFWN